MIRRSVYRSLRSTHSCPALVGVLHSDRLLSPSRVPLLESSASPTLSGRNIRLFPSAPWVSRSGPGRPHAERPTHPAAARAAHPPAMPLRRRRRHSRPTPHRPPGPPCTPLCRAHRRCAPTAARAAASRQTRGGGATAEPGGGCHR
jgi:hypothetical protein